jgi:hypothetical protein
MPVLHPSEIAEFTRWGTFVREYDGDSSQAHRMRAVRRGAKRIPAIPHFISAGNRPFVRR